MNDPNWKHIERSIRDLVQHSESLRDHTEETISSAIATIDRTLNINGPWPSAADWTPEDALLEIRSDLAALLRSLGSVAYGSDGVSE